MATYRVLLVDFDLGLCRIELHLPDGGIDVFDIDPHSICNREDMTQLELKSMLDQLVTQRLVQLFPPVPPRPPALQALVGQWLHGGGQ